MTSTTKYNTAGSPVSRTTPWDGTSTRTVRIGYADSWNDGVSRSTYAYPTVLTDPAGTTLGAAGHSSTVKYRFDIGANVEAVSPAPAGQTYGKTSRRKFDDYGRIEKESVLIDTAEQSYVRYVYPTNGVQAQSYATVVDANGNGPDSADEVASESLLDGAGRTLAARTEHPGSTGGWSAVKSSYDVLGRLYSQSVPTEVDPSWAPAGDDATRGWLYNYNFYDWKGRPLRKVNTDGDPDLAENDSDVLYSYNGCGCAGGQVTTIRSEKVARDDVSGMARRTQKIYDDILGRAFKTEILGWDGSTVYTTTINTFNGRDQIKQTRQYAGTETGSTYQTVSMTYDGMGRMKTRHYPIEDAGAATTWNYNPDGSINAVIDPRGSISNFTYDSRGLTTQVSYQPPTGGAVPDTPTVSYSYDNLGNRIGMDTDGVSNVTYAYNSLSRLTSETVDFDDLTNNLTISYGYEMGGALKTVTDPFGYAVNYTNDPTGRVTGVSGAAFAQHSNGLYANNIKYRAFGGVSGLDYKLPGSETAGIGMEYDGRLRVSRFKAAEPGSTTSFVADSTYTYLADGRTQAKDDAVNDAFDQTNKYDFAGRLKFNQFGMGAATGGGTKRVYEQAITYDAFSNMTARDTTYWGTADSFSRTYTNGRNSISAYDAAGNITNNGMGDNFQLSTFDAAGRRTGFVERVWLWEEHSARMNEFETDYIFDGDGRPVEERKGMRTVSVPNPPPMSVQVSKYQVWSSVLGASVATLLPDGTPLTRNVFAGKAVIAELRGTGSGVGDMVTWKTSDPASGTVVSYTNDGMANTGFVSEQTEPLGQSVAVTDPEPPNEPQTYEQHLFFASDPEWQCEAVGLGAYGSLFKDRPEHCQRKALYAAGAYLPWEGEVTNVTKISKPNSPFHEAKHQLGPAQKTMQNTLSITDKFASSGGPSSGDDGGWYQTGDMQWDVDANPNFPSDIELSLDPANEGDNWVDQFFREKPNCLKVLKEKLGDKFGDFGNSLRRLVFVDLRDLTTEGNAADASDDNIPTTVTYDDIMNTPAANFKIPAFAEGGAMTSYGGTMGSLNATAVTSPQTHTVYLFRPFFDEDLVTRRETKMHEGFHDYFAMSHKRILMRLGLPRQDHVLAVPGSEPFKLGSRVIPGREPVYWSEDLASALFLNHWLANDCR